MNLTSLENYFEKEVLKLVVEDICGHDQVYDLSNKIGENLTDDNLLILLKENKEIMSKIKNDEFNSDITSIFYYLRKNLTDYLDEEYIYEIAKEHDFEMI